MKKLIKFSEKKDKTGVATVITYKQGIRTLVVEGKIKVPYAILTLSVLQSIVKAVGTYCLGLFPFVSNKKDSYISTYSVPESFQKKPEMVSLSYEYSFIIDKSADNIPNREILESVLKKNLMIGECLSQKISEAIAEEYG